MNKNIIFYLLLLISISTNAQQDLQLGIQPGEEKHFKSLMMLTNGGDNAEAYWSWDGKKLIFQRTDHKSIMCDQIFIGNVPDNNNIGFKYDMLSTGKGRTTCSYFLPGDSLVLYASTHLTQDTCPPVPDRAVIKKYVWPLYTSFEMYIADTKGNIKKQLTNNNYYDAEGTVSPDGKKILFTSIRDGDLDLYTMNIDGSDVKRITSQLGYDGGAFFSADNKKIVWRASRPETDAEIQEYKELLSQNLVAPTHMHLFVANADGSDAKQITDLPRASWAPYFHPNGKQIIFASNYEHEKGFPFNLYLINIDGTGLEKITSSDTFDAFPMFSPDGKYLVFCSNRLNGGTNDTNIFIAEWKD